MGLELSAYGDRLYDMDRLPEIDSKGKLLFLVTDALGEKYGLKEAKKAVYIGFFSLISMVIVIADE